MAHQYIASCVLYHTASVHHTNTNLATFWKHNIQLLQRLYKANTDGYTQKRLRDRSRNFATGRVIDSRRDVIRKSQALCQICDFWWPISLCCYLVLLLYSSMSLSLSLTLFVGAEGVWSAHWLLLFIPYIQTGARRDRTSVYSIHVRTLTTTSLIYKYIFEWCDGLEIWLSGWFSVFSPPNLRCLFLFAKIKIQKNNTILNRF